MWTFHENDSKKRDIYTTIWAEYGLKVESQRERERETYLNSIWRGFYPFALSVYMCAYHNGKRALSSSTTAVLRLEINFEAMHHLHTLRYRYQRKKDGVRAMKLVNPNDTMQIHFVPHFNSFEIYELLRCNLRL